MPEPVDPRDSAGNTPPGEVPYQMARWRYDNAQKLRRVISEITGTGTIGGGAFPNHPPAFTPEEAANIAVDQCYLETPEAGPGEPDTVLRLEGYADVSDFWRLEKELEAARANYRSLGDSVFR